LQGAGWTHQMPYRHDGAIHSFRGSSLKSNFSRQRKLSAFRYNAGKRRTGGLRRSIRNLEVAGGFQPLSAAVMRTFAQTRADLTPRMVIWSCHS
jgi:hypothetical protein